MDKILIVGHESSYYKDLEQLLHTYGMAKAMPSHIYKITPIELNSKLLSKSSSYIPIKKRTTYSQNIEDNKDTVQLNTNNPFNQKKPKKIWDNLVFDFLFANNNQSLWGWADKDAISLLEYWANFDENIIFVLTYDKPDNIIKYLLKSYNNNINILNKTIIQEKMDEWLSYNQILLAFYQKNKKRCLLINGEQTIASTDNFIKLAIKKFPLLKTKFSSSSTIENINSSSHIVPSKYLNDDNEIVDFFTQQFLINYNNHVDLFTHIQNFSDIPLLTINKKNHAEITLNLLEKTILQQKNLTTIKNDLLQYQENLNQANKKIVDIEQKLENTQKDFSNTEKAWKQQILEAEHNYKKNKQALKNQLQEDYQKTNNTIIAQLHQTQEELEKYYLENQKIKNIIEEQKNQINNLTQIKQSFEKQITEQKQSFEKKQIAAGEENKLLITQLHEIQVELEKYYLENQTLTKKLNETNIIKQNMYYGAANRIKQDLPYRLGAMMINRSKTFRGLINLPFSLLNEYRNFKKNQDKKNLPKIEEYLDANEAERLKKHLSYRLGITLIDGIKSPISILVLPFKITKEIFKFKYKRDVK